MGSVGRVYDRLTATRLDRSSRPTEGWVTRTRLAARLGDALESGSVLLTAGPGFGKTTVLEQALRDGDRTVAWIGCSQTERSAGTLLMRILDAISRVAPGASDALSERLASAPEQVDPLAATRALLADFSRLLVEPLTLVFDDGEHLDGADESLRLLSDLVRAEVPSLHVAIASRRPLDLRVGKPRATGRSASAATKVVRVPEEVVELTLR